MPLSTFQPQGNTALVLATTTASAPQQPSTGSIQGLLLTNQSTNDAWVAFGVSTATAVLPTTSTPSAGMPLLQRSQATFGVPPNVWLSAITTAGTAAIYATPGFGQ